MNTFGDGHLAFALCDPRSIREDRRRFRRDALPLLDRANSLYIPTGHRPVLGWVLLPRYEYAQLDAYSTSLRLAVGDPSAPDNVAVLGGLSVVQAQCVTRGVAADPNAIYLVALTDNRGVLGNQWFRAPLTTAYNIRAPAYPQTFHPGTMNGGTTWTWDTMLHDMWTKLALLGTWPGLPSAPAGTPEGFWFQGAAAWPSFCDVLDHLGMTVACDPTQANPYTIVSAGAADAALAALQARYVAGNRLEDDLEWLDTGAARLPGTVQVLFRRRNEVYGTEETVRYDSPYQWDMTPLYTVPVTTAAAASGAVGVHYLQSDFTVRYDVNGTPLAADAAVAAAIAQARAAAYYARASQGYMAQTYTGALPFKTGSACSGVRYYQDYRDQARQDWKTQIVARGGAPWPGLWD